MAELFELSNGGMIVKISNWGATITYFLVPDTQGNLVDVILGFDSLDPYIKGVAPYFGCIVGRVANRIKDGKFTIQGEHYSLPINNPPNSLHDGHKGFDKVLWEETSTNMEIPHQLPSNITVEMARKVILEMLLLLQLTPFLWPCH